jgi:hypothetical protein
MKTKAFELDYPERRSEFEIQAELYALLRPICDVRGGVRSMCKDRGEWCHVVFDLVVFYPDRRPALIIECKDTPTNHNMCLPPKCRQQRRYSMFGVPVIRCGAIEQFNTIIERVKAELECDCLGGGRW